MVGEQLPVEFGAARDTEVVLFSTFPSTVRAPDAVVAPSAVTETNPTRPHAEHVLLAVEISSPGSKRTDLKVKFAEYADAFISYYWIIDLDPPVVSLSAHLLVDGNYEGLAKLICR